VREDLVEIFADDGRLDDGVSVMDESRNDRLWIEQHVGRVKLLTLQDVDVMAFPVEPFFRERQPHLRGANGRAMVIELNHAAILGSIPVDALQPDGAIALRVNR
jgi:hypothetical protein